MDDAAYSSYYSNNYESHTEKEWDEQDNLAEDTTQETMNAIYDEQEKETDY